MPHLRWKDEHVEILKKMYIEGKRNTDIAAVLGVSVRAIRSKCDTLRRHSEIGFKSEYISSFWTTKVYEQLHQLWVIEGRSGTECAMALSTSRSSILSAVRRKGWHRATDAHRPVGRKKKAFIENPDKFIVDSFNAGTSISDIARVVGQRVAQVRQHLNAMGYDTTPNRSDSHAVHPMWSMDEDSRRMAFYEKFKAGWAEVQERLQA